MSNDKSIVLPKICIDILSLLETQERGLAYGYLLPQNLLDLDAIAKLAHEELIAVASIGDIPFNPLRSFPWMLILSNAGRAWLVNNRISPVPILDCKGKIWIGAECIPTSAREEEVLRQLARLGSADMKELIKESDVDQPGRVLANLRKKHPVLEKHIRLPGSKAHGGYSTTIQLES